MKREKVAFRVLLNNILMSIFLQLTYFSINIHQKSSRKSSHSFKRKNLVSSVLFQLILFWFNFKWLWFHYYWIKIRSDTQLESWEYQFWLDILPNNSKNFFAFLDWSNNDAGLYAITTNTHHIWCVQMRRSKKTLNFIQLL